MESNTKALQTPKIRLEPLERAPSISAPSPSNSAYELEEVELDGFNENENGKHGVTSVTVPLTSSSSERGSNSSPSRVVEIPSARKSKANPVRSSRQSIPPECWERILQHVRKELTDIEWRNVKRDRAALRSLWALIPDRDDDDRVYLICDALDQAALRDDTAQGLFSMATGILERDCGGTRTAAREDYADLD